MKRKEVEFYLNYYLGDGKYPVQRCYVYETINSEFCVFDFGCGFIAIIEYSLGCFQPSDIFEDMNCLNRFGSSHFLISGNCVNLFLFVFLLNKYRDAGLLK